MMPVRSGKECEPEVAMAMLCRSKLAVAAAAAACAASLTASADAAVVVPRTGQPPLAAANAIPTQAGRAFEAVGS